MLLEGKRVAQALDEATARQCGELHERADDLSYERGALKRCQKVGIEPRVYALPQDTGEKQLLELVESLNRDETIHGVLMLRPFPAHIRDEAVRAALDPAKDVDGITDGSLAGVFAGTGRGFAPCTAEACIRILEHYHIDPAGRRAVVVGRSLVVGRPAAMLLLHKNATVTLCHAKTQNLPQVCHQAEILVVAVGKMGAVGAECAAPGQIVLDVGIHMGEDGKLRGDTDFAAMEPVVEAITPVPGGVGAVTTSVLAEHVARAAARQCQ